MMRVVGVGSAAGVVSEGVPLSLGWDGSVQVTAMAHRGAGKTSSRVVGRAGGNCTAFLGPGQRGGGGGTTDALHRYLIHSTAAEVVGPDG